MNTLFVTTARAAQPLEMTLKGLLWCDLSPLDNVVIVVNNSNERNAHPDVLSIAREFAQKHAPFYQLFEYTGPPSESGVGRGFALHDACRRYPSEWYVRIDEDMFPITRDWLPRLLASTQRNGTELGTAFTNMNGNCVVPFMQYLERPVCHLLSYQGVRVDYKDAKSQLEVWQATLADWDKIVSWNNFKRFDGETDRKEQYLVNSNCHVFHNNWFQRRDRIDWAIKGEDEMAINRFKHDDQDTYTFDHNALLLHWGYSPALPLLKPLWSEVAAKLEAHWGLI